MSSTDLIFIGFLTKRSVAADHDWLPDNVSAICSASECISGGPPDRISHWLHNRAGLYDTAELAWQVTPLEDRAAYELFAYRMAPFAFDEGGRRQWRPEDPTPVAPEVLADFESLGFDVVGRGYSDFFECSPLSCNGMATEFDVNEFCLLDDLDEAMRVGTRFGDPGSNVEPAVYFVVEVLRATLRSLSRGAP